MNSEQVDENRVAGLDPAGAGADDRHAPHEIGAEGRRVRRSHDPGERIGDVLDRVGLDDYRRALKPVVGPALLTAEEIHQPKWTSFFYPGVVAAFPIYGAA